MRPSLDPDYFDALYAADPDPWCFETSGYERQKYDATLAVLPPRAESGLEIGCSIGVLTQRLAAHCAALLAVDVAPAALARARARCADLPTVSFRQCRVPHEWPPGSFDLILLSEVLYYFDAADIAATATHVLASLRPAGRVLLVHWLGPTDYPISGDAAVEVFLSACSGRLATVSRQRTAQYRLDLLG